ncbi:MAG: PorV/PorQ family protein [Calditrichaeota bacterium]|nr:MAG: PorV/PorQ family protein [Calditrichota bacterium]
MKIIIKLFLLILLCRSALFANSPGTSGFQFLKMQVGARAAGMAGAFAAVPADVHALFYNPAGIADIQKKTATFSYQDDLLDFNSGFIGYVHPMSHFGNVGFSVLYRDYGQFTKTDITGQELGSFGANSIAFSASYAMIPIENLFIGGNAKYIRGAIETFSADALAADVGIMYRIPMHELVLAAGIFNAGAQLNAFITAKDALPLLFRAGVTKKLAHLPLMFALNTYKYNDEPWYFALGGEFTVTPAFFLRFGYNSYGRDLGVDSSKDTLAGASAGIGFLWNNLSVDYSYSSVGALGSLNRFTLSGQF